MTSFVVLAALLSLVVVVLLLRPLLDRRRDPGRSAADLNVAVYRQRLAELEASLEQGEIAQGDYAEARRELDQALLEDVSEPASAGHLVAAPGARWVGIAVALAVPVIGAGLYWQLGAHHTLRPSPTAARPAGPVDGEKLPAVEDMVAGLEARLREDPDDASGWLTLGRSYVVMQRYGEGAGAFARAHELVGDEPNLLVDYAEALALANANRLDGRPAELARRALELDPEHPKALWLAGFAARQAGDPTTAAALWTRLSAALPPDSAQAQVLARLLETARAEGGLESASVPTTAQAAHAGIQVQVRLAEALKDEAGASQTVFVFARAVDGPPMPVAIARLRAGDLPATVRLDDTTSMLPTAKLSTFPRVVVGARISRTGNAMPSSGDLQGMSGIVEQATLDGPVDIEIAHRVP